MEDAAELDATIKKAEPAVTAALLCICLGGICMRFFYKSRYWPRFWSWLTNANQQGQALALVPLPAHAHAPAPAPAPAPAQAPTPDLVKGLPINDSSDSDQDIVGA